MTARRRDVRRGLLVLAGTAAVTAAVVTARRKLDDIDPLPDLTGAPVRLDTPLRTPLGATSDARVLPPAWEPAPLTTLARWQPPPPRHPLSRAVAYAWAAPLTLAGLLAATLTGVRPQLRDGAIVFPNARGPAGALLRNRRYRACAIGHVIVALPDPDARLMAHELVHVRHAERLGVLTPPLYLALLAVYGYARHPLERAARAAARRVAGRS